MAIQSLTRSLLSKPKTLTFLLLSRPFSSSAAAATTTTTSSFSFSAVSRSPFSLLHPHSAVIPVGFHRGLSTSEATPPLREPNLKLSNEPPKEMILLDGCDFEHWLVVMEKPQGDPTRDEIIDSYIKTLSQIFGSEEEARMKIYAVSTRCYFAFGCLVSEELSYKIRELPGVRWVLPDSYLDVKNKTYGGEPFINGQAVPYHPKYHEEWTRNNAKANRRNERPRTSDRSRNFERRENTQNCDFQNPPMSNQPRGVHNSPPMSNVGGKPPNAEWPGNGDAEYPQNFQNREH